MIEVKTTLVKRKHTSLLLQQDIYRNDVLLFKASILAVYVKDLKPSRIPDDMYEVLA